MHVAPNLASAEVMTGTIDSVVDGDLITIISRGKEIEIRLFGIDAPEKNQPFGQSAKNFTGAMASGKEIRIEPMRKDTNGRIVAMVFVNGANLNEQIVSQGFAWVSRQECKESFCTDWLQLEAIAKAAQKGLWADEHPAPPWEHRKNRRDSGASKGDALAATISSTSVKIVTGAPAPYHGDTKSHLFHSAACKEFNCPTCTVNFQSVTEALDAGYKPHRECVTK